MKEVKSFTTFDFTIILGFISRVIIDIERYLATLIKLSSKKKNKRAKTKKLILINLEKKNYTMLRSPQKKIILRYNFLKQ